MDQAAIGCGVNRLSVKYKGDLFVRRNIKEIRVPLGEPAFIFPFLIHISLILISPFFLINQQKRKQSLKWRQQ